MRAAFSNVCLCAALLAAKAFHRVAALRARRAEQEAQQHWQLLKPPLPPKRKRMLKSLLKPQGWPTKLLPPNWLMQLLQPKYRLPKKKRGPPPKRKRTRTPPLLPELPKLPKLPTLK